MSAIASRPAAPSGPVLSAPATARRRFLRRVGYAAALLPASLATVGAVAAGRPDAARRWWARAAEQDLAADDARTARRPGPARLLAHALMTLPLGLLSLIPLGIELLFVLRGVLYGFVDHGPYDHSWGGPTRGGAWLAHFAVSVPFAVAGLGTLWLLNRLHARLAGGMWGRRAGFWPVLAVAVASVAGAMLFVAWLHQI